MYHSTMIYTNVYLKTVMQCQKEGFVDGHAIKSKQAACSVEARGIPVDHSGP